MNAIITITGRTYPTPLFLPVFERNNPYITAPVLRDDFGVRGIITNGFLLYRDRSLREALAGPESRMNVKQLYGFDGLVMTDSGAYQALGGQVYVKNTKIIRFQQDIGADVISPFDHITPPRDNWKVANRKLNDTLKNIEQGLKIADRAILAGVQQGGRYLDLRERSVRALVELGVSYVALGSLVPFFGRNHHIRFAGQVIRQARAIVPPEIPIHLYGAGDPVELPFYAALGCDIFDSSSFVHFARGGWYMTPYGASQTPEALAEYECPCPYCAAHGARVWADERLMALHNLWTIMHVMRCITDLRASGGLDDYLDAVLDKHMRWFPASQLKPSWEEI
ncbi:MAG: tRNA-guanine transglycosylase [Anaerolineae bacterium]|nr:tRNA-guanine transglycosylase [Anaerolineae bacterium]